MAIRPFRRVSASSARRSATSAAEGVPDDGELAEIALEDQFGQKLGLVARRVALVERLVGAAEALEVDGDDLVVAGEVGRDVPPGEGVGAEAVDQQDRGAFAALDRVELDRRIRRPEPREGKLVCFVGGERKGAGRGKDRRERKRR